MTEQRPSKEVRAALLRGKACAEYLGSIRVMGGHDWRTTVEVIDKALAELPAVTKPAARPCVWRSGCKHPEICEKQDICVPGGERLTEVARENNRLANERPASECGACDKPGAHCANQYGICSRHSAIHGMNLKQTDAPNDGKFAGVADETSACPHGIRWPHECKECADAVVVPEDWRNQLGKYEPSPTGDDDQ